MRAAVLRRSTFLLALALLLGQLFVRPQASAALPSQPSYVSRAQFARILAVALELPPAPEASSFSDIADKPTQEAASQVQRAGLVHGFPDGTFRPHQPVTRAQAVAVLLSAVRHLPQSPAHTLAPLPGRRGMAPPFTDVPRRHWAYVPIAQAWQQGLIAGTASNRFSPERPVSAGELAQFLLRFLGPAAAGRADFVLSSLPEPPPPARAANAIPILLYHHLAPRGSGFDQNSATVTPEEFAWQMDYLDAAGYRVLNAEELAAFLAGRADVPARSVAITFDDGYASNLRYALPILKKHNFPAIINVITGEVPETPQIPYDPRRLQRLSWPELRELVASGLVTIGSHTANLHKYVPTGPSGGTRPALVARLYDAATGQVESEAQYRQRVLSDLIASRSALERELGAQVTILAFPYGVSDPLSRRLAAEAGFSLTFGTRPALARRASGLSDVPRLVVRPGLAQEQFASLLRDSQK